MPYIKQEKRRQFEFAETLDGIGDVIESTGDFNYVISYLANYMTQRLEKKGYCQMSAIRGAISDAAEEYYRRVMVDYENEKCRDNGDVYDGPEAVVGTGQTVEAQQPDEHISVADRMLERHLCQTCKKAKGTRRFNNCLDAGWHCDKCWDRLMSEARSRSWSH
jgi:ribosomal protein L37AE/L43A